MSFFWWTRTGDSSSHHSDHEDGSQLRGRAGWREAWSCGHVGDAISALNCYLQTSPSGRKINFLKPLFFSFFCYKLLNPVLCCSLVHGFYSILSFLLKCPIIKIILKFKEVTGNMEKEKQFCQVQPLRSVESGQRKLIAALRCSLCF